MLTFMREQYCTSIQYLAILFRRRDLLLIPINSKFQRTCLGAILLSLLSSTAFAWEIDLSRRRQERQQQEVAAPVRAQEPENIFDRILSSSEAMEDVVIINSEKGFVPATVRLRRDRRYVFYVVNVNSSEKNISFVMDAFSQHHSTYFGETKSFLVEPKKEGIYSYQCPETGAQGRVIVYGGEQPVLMRMPAAEGR